MMINVDTVYAGIVLFNPDMDRLKLNIESLEKQVNDIVLIDNGSNNYEMILSKYSNKTNIHCIHNEENKGIASALNQIIVWGIQSKFEWCLTMDQDSIADETMVENMVIASKEIDEPRIAVFLPTVCDVNMKLDSMSNKANKYSYVTVSTDAITSGSLVNVSAASDVGFYNEDYFIDYVDTEFQERLLRNNYKLIRVSDAILMHEVGHMVEKFFLGKKVLCSNHSAFRRYYQVRNRLAFRKKYFGYKAYIKEKVRLCLGTLKIVIFEDDKKGKISATIRGFKDFHKLL